MRIWHDEYKGRLYLKKQFIKVREDPFHSSNLKNFYVLRIEVYPETEDDRYFSLQLKKNKKVFREETCLFDEEGHLEIIWGADAYNIILKSCYKTHIPRDLFKEDSLKKNVEQKEALA